MLEATAARITDINLLPNRIPFLPIMTAILFEYLKTRYTSNAAIKPPSRTLIRL